MTLKWFLLLLCQVRDINSKSRGNAKKDATQTKPILFQICITFEKCDSNYVIFFFPEKGKGGRKSLQKRWGKPPFRSSLFSSPLPFFGKEKYDVTGVALFKSDTNSEQNGLSHVFLFVNLTILGTFGLVSLLV